MRLVFDPWSRKVTVETLRSKDQTLGQVAKAIRLDGGFATPQALQRAAGIDHPRWRDLELDNSNSLKTLLEGLEACGYDMRVVKVKQ